MAGHPHDGQEHVPAPNPLRQSPRRRLLRISTQIPSATLESRVSIKAAQMYVYIQDEIERIESGESPFPPPECVVADDFDAVRRAAERIHMQPYDVFINSTDPLVYFFGAPKDDGDTDVTTKLLYALFETDGIARTIFFHDGPKIKEVKEVNNEEEIVVRKRMPFLNGRFARTSHFPTGFSHLHLLIWTQRTIYESITTGPDKGPAFTVLDPQEKLETMQKIKAYFREWSAIERNLVAYLSRNPRDRCFEYLEELVKHMVCRERTPYLREKLALHALEHYILPKEINNPENLVREVHRLVQALVGPSVPGDNYWAYCKELRNLPRKICELRDKRFAYVLRLHEAISPDMARFKVKVPEGEWHRYQFALPNLAGLLREANINYAIFVPKPEAVFKYPDSVLGTL